jgi:hypothetical protein
VKNSNVNCVSLLTLGSNDCTERRKRDLKTLSLGLASTSLDQFLGLSAFLVIGTTNEEGLQTSLHLSRSFDRATRLIHNLLHCLGDQLRRPRDGCSRNRERDRCWER